MRIRVEYPVYLDDVLMTANYPFMLENFMLIWNMKEKIVFYFKQKLGIEFLGQLHVHNHC